MYINMGEEQVDQFMTNPLFGKVLKVAMGEVFVILRITVLKQNCNSLILMSPESSHVLP